MTCDVCSNPIPKGTRYKSPRYTANHFCCEECYNVFLESKQNKPKAKPSTPNAKLIAYLDSIYPSTLNYPWIQRQIKSIKTNYDLDEDQILLTIRYAVEYEDVQPIEGCGLGVWIPKYIEPMQEFCEQIKQAKVAAKDIEDGGVEVVKKQGKGKRIWREK